MSSNLQNALHWIKERHLEENPEQLTDGMIVSIMKNEFETIRTTANEFLFTDYDTLDLLTECGVTDPAFLEMATTDACSGQCCKGEEIESMSRQMVESYRTAGNIPMALATEKTIGGIYLYAASLLNVMRVMFHENVCEMDVRRIVRFFLGHEREHATQTLSFIQEGRVPVDSTSLLCANAEDVYNDPEMMALLMEYVAVPSEMAADAAGMRFMQSFEN